jgi:hypothetical protein
MWIGGQRFLNSMIRDITDRKQAMAQCLSLIKTLNVNQAAWRLYQANSKEQLIFNPWQVRPIGHARTRARVRRRD